MRSIFLCEDPACPLEVYSEETVRYLEETAGLDRRVYNKAALEARPQSFADTEFIFTSWHMPVLSEEEIRTLLPGLKAVFYAAGTVQYFARPFLNCGVAVFSAWAANAVPVAEYTVAQIILANKGFFRATALMSGGDPVGAKEAAKEYDGNYGARVGLLGAGMVGKQVIRMLKGYRLEVLVFDPFLPEETAAELGVRKCGLEEIFSTCGVVSNHMANNAQTEGMLNGALFASMPRNATFLNTGRGAQVVEADLAEVLRLRPDLTAVLDVTKPEPPMAGHSFYALPNCVLTPHIAGSKGKEVHRMAEFMADEFGRYVRHEPAMYRVTPEMLATMA